MSNKCRKCGAEIIWITTPAGKSMPCDPGLILLDPNGTGKDKIVTPDGVVWSGEIVSGCIDDDKSLIVQGHLPHWATCPNADEFRKGESK